MRAECDIFLPLARVVTWEPKGKKKQTVYGKRARWATKHEGFPETADNVGLIFLVLFFPPFYYYLLLLIAIIREALDLFPSVRL